MSDNMAAYSTATGLFGTPVDLDPTKKKIEVGPGHNLVRKTFHKPTFCHHCTEMLWGILKQGYSCEVCNFVSHERCLEFVATPCITVAADRITKPVSHSWSDPGAYRKKFCNVCRRKLDEALAVKCEVCEYYVHLHCLDFALNNCIEVAHYEEDVDPTTATIKHHWRDGNLPTNSRCVVCKKSCASSECLTGMQCDWCYITAHAGCFKTIPEECDFGSIHELILPPWSVSMPITNADIKGDILTRVQDLNGTTRFKVWLDIFGHRMPGDEQTKFYVSNNHTTERSDNNRARSSSLSVHDRAKSIHDICIFAASCSLLAFITNALTMLVPNCLSPWQQNKVTMLGLAFNLTIGCCGADTRLKGLPFVHVEMSCH